MSDIQELVSVEEWKDLWDRSATTRVFLFKHSTTCPISTAADEQFRSFVSNYEGEEAEFAFLKVRESRPVSNQIAEDLNIQHESPQFFIIENREVKWCDSHWKITEKNIKSALNN